jgi:hypothetical protein
LKDVYPKVLEHAPAKQTLEHLRTPGDVVAHMVINMDWKDILAVGAIIVICLL